MHRIHYRIGYPDRFGSHLYCGRWMGRDELRARTISEEQLRNGYESHVVRNEILDMRITCKQCRKLLGFENPPLTEEAANRRPTWYQ